MPVSSTVALRLLVANSGARGSCCRAQGLRRRSSSGCSLVFEDGSVSDNACDSSLRPRTTLLGPPSPARIPKTRPRSNAVLREVVALKASSALSALTSVTHASRCPSSTAAAKTPAADLSLRPGGPHPCIRPHRRNGDLTHPAHRPCDRSSRPHAVALACLPLVASPGDLRAPTRRGVEREHRQRVLRRHAVPALDVQERRRPIRRPGGPGHTQGAAVPGMVGLAP